MPTRIYSPPTREKSHVPTNTISLTSRKGGRVHLVVHKIDQVAHVGAAVQLDALFLAEERGFVWAVTWAAHFADFGFLEWLVSDWCWFGITFFGGGGVMGERKNRKRQGKEGGRETGNIR